MCSCVAQVLDALRVVIDPDLHADIVSAPPSSTTPNPCIFKTTHPYIQPYTPYMRNAQPPTASKQVSLGFVQELLVDAAQGRVAFTLQVKARRSLARPTP